MALSAERVLSGRSVLLLGAAVHLAFAAAVFAVLGEEGFVAPDTATYVEPAGALLDPGPADLHRFLPRRLIGYPVLIGASRRIFGESLLPVVAIQALAAGACAWVALRAARALRLGPAGRAAAAAAVVLSPNVLAHSSAVLTDFLHAAAVLAGAYGLLAAFRARSGAGVPAALAFWAAAHTLRPTLHAVILLAPLLLAVLRRAWGWTPPPASLAASALILAAAPAGLLIGNHALDGVWTVSRTDETNARLLAACTLAAATGEDHRRIVERWEAQDRELPSSVEVRRARLSRVREVLSEHPILAARVAAGNAVKTLLSPADGAYAVLYGARGRRTLPALLLAAGNAAAWMIILVGARACLGDPAGRSWTLVAALLAAFVVAVSSPVGYQGARFRLPADLLAAPLLGAGLEAMMKRWTRDPVARRIPPSAARSGGGG